MHQHHMAHLDISLTNLLMDDRGNYAYIDYEISRRYDGVTLPRISDYRATEVPPELENGGCSDPYKVDVWALGILILRVCEVRDINGLLLISNGNVESQLTGYHVPDLILLVRCMLHPNHEARPTAQEALDVFDTMLSKLRGV